jgi:hypothetical protein
MDDDKYKRFYEDGPTKVGVMLTLTTKDKTQEPIQLEGILTGEDNTNLFFSKLKSINLGLKINDNITISINGGLSIIKKAVIALMYKKYNKND